MITTFTNGVGAAPFASQTITTKVIFAYRSKYSFRRAHSFSVTDISQIDSSFVRVDLSRSQNRDNFDRSICSKISRFT
jgi:hypothetical protein